MSVCVLLFREEGSRLSHSDLSIRSLLLSSTISSWFLNSLQLILLLYIITLHVFAIYLLFCCSSTKIFHSTFNIDRSLFPCCEVLCYFSVYVYSVCCNLLLSQPHRFSPNPISACPFPFLGFLTSQFSFARLHFILI